MRIVPWGILIVGFVGLFGFFAFPLAMAFGSPTLAINAYLQLIHFGALVLSFVGATHWGLAIGANARGITVPSPLLCSMFRQPRVATLPSGTKSFAK